MSVSFSVCSSFCMSSFPLCYAGLKKKKKKKWTSMTVSLLAIWLSQYLIFCHPPSFPSYFLVTSVSSRLLCLFFIYCMSLTDHWSNVKLICLKWLFTCFLSLGWDKFFLVTSVLCKQIMHIFLCSKYDFCGCLVWEVKWASVFLFNVCCIILDLWSCSQNIGIWTLYAKSKSSVVWILISGIWCVHLTSLAVKMIWLLS